MFPIRDDNPTLRDSVTTKLIIGLNVAVWVLLQGMGSEPRLTQSVCELGLIPGEFLRLLPAGTRLPLGPGAACVLGDGGGLTLLSPISSMFMHGSWFHLIGNMWFLWVFGNNVEDVMGRRRFFLFYILCGLSAAAVQMAMSPASPVPMIGASGAIGGIMGGYVALYPHARIRSFVFVFFLDVPAYVMLGYWFLLQLAGGAMPSEGGGVAFWAHIGGFLAGLLLTPLFRDAELLALHHRSHAI